MYNTVVYIVMQCNVIPAIGLRPSPSCAARQAGVASAIYIYNVYIYIYIYTHREREREREMIGLRPSPSCARP